MNTSSNARVEVDLTQAPPRSPRVRLGGFVHLPRLIDKARAAIAGKLGVYVYGSESLLDQQFFDLTGISPEAFLDKVRENAGDWAILQWVQANTHRPMQAFQIQAWSQWLETLPGLSPEARAWFAEFSQSLDPARPDVSTLFEYLDLDDFVRFGGQA
ncbi:DUF5069 domain-containing protein [Pelagicoccus sp. SDUM812003]|uniref:DUF5069 domain-containing protein n=1 Tax=Pelagicoccus sp. SDUM812003 TaxID=3041267 RepID=UPI0028108BED|nr:DUF5069 domain-containing protein [Pelagicoccus sp. SDUM812003]MDQ8202201.1 DUF5069 domain-containing protein [Pelagicoccus sp. SDUM812003]